MQNALSNLLKSPLVTHLRAKSRLSVELVNSLREMLPPELRETARLFLSTEAYNVFVHDDELLQYFNPTSLRDVLSAGHIGSMLGLAVVTDAFCDHHPRALAPYHVYVVSADGARGHSIELLDF